MDIIGQNPSVSMSNRLHVVIVRAFFINLKYNLVIGDNFWHNRLRS